MTITKQLAQRRMKQKKIKISWVVDVNHYMNIDFGLFESHRENQIEVSETFWRKYCEARLMFELMQKDLVDKINRKRSLRKQDLRR